MIVTRGYGSGALVTRGYAATSSDYEFVYEYFRHIWPAKYDPLCIEAIATAFNFIGVPYNKDVYSLQKAYWINGVFRIMYIKGDK